MNWFERHLNWAYVLSQIVGVLVMVLAYLTAGGYTAGAYLVLILYLLLLVSPFVIGGWVLTKKKRSLLWLFTMLIGVGGIIVLVLKNKSKGMPSK